jgi:hypothetical protein
LIEFVEDLEKRVVWEGKEGSLEKRGRRSCSR